MADDLDDADDTLDPEGNLVGAEIPTTTTSPTSTTTTTVALPLTYVPPTPTWMFPQPFPEAGGLFGSGCSPGTDVLPDGAWFGFVEAKTPNGISFDLACIYYEPDSEIDTRIENDNPRLRDIPVTSTTPVKAGNCSYDEPDEVPFSEWDPMRVGWSCWVWIYINGGEVTYIAEPYFS